MRFVAALLAFVLPLAAQYSATVRPRFEDFPAGEVFQGPNASVQLLTSSERMFKTRLTEASREAPNFAGHLRFVIWGCGTECGAGAFVDLKTGRVVQPPHTAGSHGWRRWMFRGGFWSTDQPEIEHRTDSRLFILRTGKTYIERLEEIVPDTYYFEWDGERFRPLLHIPADEAGRRSKKR